MNELFLLKLHREAIIQIFEAAESRGIRLWLESGWAIDARLGRITRVHEDIDVAYAHECEKQYIELLTDLGFSNLTRMDYGFLMTRGNVLIDSEPCFFQNDEYNFPEFPIGSCPDEPEGNLFGKSFRCLSWVAMLHEFSGYEREVPQSNWREKDFESFRIIKQHAPMKR